MTRTIRARVHQPSRWHYMDVAGVLRPLSRDLYGALSGLPGIRIKTRGRIDDYESAESRNYADLPKSFTRDRYVDEDDICLGWSAETESGVELVRFDARDVVYCGVRRFYDPCEVWEHVYRVQRWEIQMTTDCDSEEVAPLEALRALYLAARALFPACKSKSGSSRQQRVRGAVLSALRAAREQQESDEVQSSSRSNSRSNSRPTAIVRQKRDESEKLMQPPPPISKRRMRAIRDGPSEISVLDPFN